MRILVTGGAGYIGSVTCAALLEAGHEVIVYDNLSHGYRQAIAPLKRVALLVGDISDRGRLDQVFSQNQIDAVMHFAAWIEVGESMKIPEAYFRNNVAATLVLFEAMIAHSIKKFVFSSTAALFGSPERVPIEEADPLRPTNVYGESKGLVERMLAWFQSIHGISYASLRYFNAAGAYGDLGEAHHPETHLIPLVLQVALGKRESISVFGTDYPTPDGTCVRDYVHVWDLAQAHVLAVQALETKPKQIYNLGNGKGFSVRQVIDVARRITQRPIQVVEGPRRSGDPAVLVASSDKIRRELGWTPKYPDLESIISSAWDWHLKHPNGYV